MVLIITILCITIVFAISYIFRLKYDLKGVTKVLNEIKDLETNTRLTTKTFNKDVVNLANLINKILDKNKQTILEKELQTREFRQGITNISHDLRTPLTSVKGYLDLLNSTNLSKEKEKLYLDIISKRLNALTELIETFFEYTQILEQDKLVLEKVNVTSILKEELAAYYEAFENQNFKTNVNISEDDIFIIGDRNLLIRVFQNLLKNVLVHGDNYFEVYTNSKERRITFKNNGKQIKTLDVSRIFERFYTGDESRIENNTGLGLLIVKEILSKMGGEIKASTSQDTISIEILL